MDCDSHTTSAQEPPVTSPGEHRSRIFPLARKNPLQRARSKFATQLRTPREFGKKSFKSHKNKYALKSIASQQ